MRPTLPFIAITLGLAGCAPAGDRPDEAGGANDVPPVTVLGEAQSCINRINIRETVVRSDKVIDFEMRGGDVYRNTLPNRCPSLDLQRAITYNTEINQFCQTEIVYVLENFAGRFQRGAGCALGPFVPVEYVEDKEDSEDGEG